MPFLPKLVPFPSQYPMPELTRLVFDLGSKLKFFDPCARQYTGAGGKDALPDWLQQLKTLLDQYEARDWVNDPLKGQLGFKTSLIYENKLKYEKMEETT